MLPYAPHTECDTVGADSISARGIYRARFHPAVVCCAKIFIDCL